MTEQNDAPAQDTTETAEQTADEPSLTESLKAEAEKWKQLSRQNEKRAKENYAQLEELRKQGMSEAERAIAEAREQARKAALAEAGHQLAVAELRTQAASAGLALPDKLADYVDTSRLLGEDGKPDPGAVKLFLESLPERKTAYPQNLGIGPQSSGERPEPDYSPRELAKRVRDRTLY